MFPHQQHQQMEANASEEKLSALKKVYAEILLNTAKESAAQIIASERKVLHFRQSLNSTKEEAVQTLVRFKCIMDAKVSEAETVSLSQIRRIQDLELQLRESENTIKSLKMELEKCNEELQKIKEKSVGEPHRHSVEAGLDHLKDPCSENGMAIPVSISSEKTIKCHKMELKRRNEELQNIKEQPAEESGKHFVEAVNPYEAPSDDNGMIIPDSLPSSSGSDVGYDAMSEVRSQPADSLRHLILEQNCHGNHEIASVMIGKEPDFLRIGCTQRIRASEQNSSTSVKEEEKSSEFPSDACTNDLNQNLYLVKHDAVTCFKMPDGSDEVAGKSIKCENGKPVRFSRQLSSRNCRSKYATRSDFVNCDLDSLKFSCSETSQKEMYTHSSQLVKCGNNHKEGERAFTVVEGNSQSNDMSVEVPHDSDSKPAIEQVHCSPVNSILRTCGTNETPGNMIGDQIVKFTFQRKRLKRSLSTVEDTSIENNEKNQKRKMLDMSTCSAEANNLSQVLESPQESHLIAQVAHQLISLSQKRR